MELRIQFFEGLGSEWATRKHGAAGEPVVVTIPDRTKLVVLDVGNTDFVLDVRRRGAVQTLRPVLHPERHQNVPMSRVQMFIEDECFTRKNVGADRQIADALAVKCEDLFARWVKFAKRAGFETGSSVGFGKYLKRVVPDLGKQRLGSRKGRTWYYTGIAVKPALAHASY